MWKINTHTIFKFNTLLAFPVFEEAYNYKIVQKIPEDYFYRNNKTMEVDIEGQKNSWLSCSLSLCSKKTSS